MIMTLGDDISVETQRKIRQWCRLLEQTELEGIIDWLPTYTNITFYYAPDVWEYDQLVRYLQHLADRLEPSAHIHVRVHEIPVCYGGEFGPDLAEVADYHGLRAEEVIEIHTAPQYLVYMIGFAPGFPYLGGMSPAIATPRLAEPRSKIPAGSVGIAGAQTGIYPLESPGGWRIIGRTPLSLFTVEREPPSLLKAGDQVRFRPISRDEYVAIKEAQTSEGK